MIDDDTFIPNQPRWMARASCRGLGTSAFFGDRPEETDEARAVCELCPTRAECLEFALDDRSLVGIWAGTDEAERRRIRRRRRAA
jgi:WhiB family transcriptional regulator, redox-sensing transcriptional regulator